MKFIFFYSEIYDFYFRHITKNLNDMFEIEPIKIDNISNNNNGHTFFGGVSIKIELIIQKIKENIGNTIIFTDATIFINKDRANELKGFFDNYLENDLCFADNTDSFYNIGIILIKCSEKTLHFFENVLQDLIHSKGWDQEVVNKHISCNLNNLQINKFEPGKIHCGFEFYTHYIDTFLIFKSFIHHSKDLNQNFNLRLDLFKKNGLITEEEYNQEKREPSVIGIGGS